MVLRCRLLCVLTRWWYPRRGRTGYSSTGIRIDNTTWDIMASTFELRAGFPTPDETQFFTESLFPLAFFLAAPNPKSFISPILSSLLLSGVVRWVGSHFDFWDPPFLAEAFLPVSWGWESEEPLTVLTSCCPLALRTSRFENLNRFTRLCSVLLPQ